MICYICNENDTKGEDALFICDGCNKGFHVSCMTFKSIFIHIFHQYGFIRCHNDKYKHKSNQH